MTDETHGDTTTDTDVEQQQVGEQHDDTDTTAAPEQEQGSEAPVTRDEIAKMVADQGQRIADRQVNALMKRLDQDGKGKQRRDKEDNNSSSEQGQERATQDRYDQREARMAYREYLSDQHTFVHSSERELATTLGAALVSDGLAEHGEPDRAGRAAAEQVAKQLSDYRKAIEQSQLTRLRKQGAVVTEPNRGGDSPSSGAAPTQSTTADLRSSAKDMAAEFNKELGHPA